MKAIYELISGSIPFILIIVVFQMFEIFDWEFIHAFTLFSLIYLPLWGMFRWFFISELKINNYCESPCSIERYGKTWYATRQEAEENRHPPDTIVYDKSFDKYYVKKV